MIPLMSLRALDSWHAHCFELPSSTKRTSTGKACEARAVAECEDIHWSGSHRELACDTFIERLHPSPSGDGHANNRGEQAIASTMPDRRKARGRPVTAIHAPLVRASPVSCNNKLENMASLPNDADADAHGQDKRRLIPRAPFTHLVLAEPPCLFLLHSRRRVASPQRSLKHVPDCCADGPCRLSAQLKAHLCDPHAELLPSTSPQHVVPPVEILARVCA